MTENCRLEVKGFIENANSMNAKEHRVALQCRDCGAAEVRHVETLGEPFYGGWASEGDDPHEGLTEAI